MQHQAAHITQDHDIINFIVLSLQCTATLVVNFYKQKQDSGNVTHYGLFFAL